MEHNAYFPDICISERQVLCGLNLFDAGGCMAAQAEEPSDRNALYHHASILRAYLVLQAWRQKADTLLIAAGKPLTYKKPEKCGRCCQLSEFTGIRKSIGGDGVTVSWLASALTETLPKSKYLSLYYALMELAGGDLWEQLKEYTAQQNISRFQDIISRLKLDEEECEERGREYQRTDFDQDLFEVFLHIGDTMHHRYYPEP